MALDRASSADFDALLPRGGAINPNTLRIRPEAVSFVKSFLDAGKAVAAICHGPWTVINAAARGPRMTYWPSLEIDLRNTGVRWVDEEAVTNQGLMTSRKPYDMRFSTRLILLRAANLALQGRVEAPLWLSMYCLTIAIGAPPQEVAK